MSNTIDWLANFDAANAPAVEGVVPVDHYVRSGRPPEEVVVMEKAATYGASAVFFEAPRNGRAAIAQALIFVSDGSDDQEFAALHQRLWSWGGVPLLYRRLPGVVQLFRCAHGPDFVDHDGKTVCRPFRTLSVAADIACDPWWDATRLRNGTIWDDPEVCETMLSARKAAHKRLIDAVRHLSEDLNTQGILPKRLRRRLLILSLLIAYLEERGVLLPDYFGQFRKGAARFFEVLAHGESLLKLLGDLESRFNGNVFLLDAHDRNSLRGNGQLVRFARMVEAKQEQNGQLTLWELYSFKDLPVELISHIYQLFVSDTDVAVYTPPFLVRLMLDEAMSWERLDYLQTTDQVILDPACGSGVFLVEAYKRLVLHWRSRNDWKRPGKQVLKSLLNKVHGIDLEEGAVELATFSLYLALCDALEPEAIRSSMQLFPVLAGKTIHHSCFFAAKERALIKKPIGVLTGNPPFSSKLTTESARRAYERYRLENGALPDKQVAYLFLHEGMEMVAPGGVLSLLQQYNLFYNQQSSEFRHAFLAKWDVREVLDFVSVRGLFQKGGADTKVVVVLAESAPPPMGRHILHATFRRSGRLDAEHGFDIDYYDLHWVPQDRALKNDSVWRANLLGGGRMFDFIERLKAMPTIGSHAAAMGWDCGEGFIEAQTGSRRPADHLTGKKLVPPSAICDGDIDRSAISTVTTKLFRTSYTAARFTPPMFLIREQLDLDYALWNDSYLTFKNKIVGICAPPKDLSKLRSIAAWFAANRRSLQAYVAGISVRAFTQKATTLSEVDILSLPFPASGDLDISPNEKLLVDDVVEHLSEFVRIGEESVIMQSNGFVGLEVFRGVLTNQINAIYKTTPIAHLQPFGWPGMICQPFVFGGGRVDWSDAAALRERLGKLLREQCGSNLHVTRIARIYDGRFVFLLKPDRLRYWLPSIALRDADDVLADLRTQGF